MFTYYYQPVRSSCVPSAKFKMHTYITIDVCWTYACCLPLSWYTYKMRVQQYRICDSLCTCDAIEKGNSIFFKGIQGPHCIEHYNKFARLLFNKRNWIISYTSLTLSLILLLLLYLLSVFSTIGAGKYNFSLNYTCIAFVIIKPFTYQFVYQKFSLSSSPKTFSSLQLAVRKIRIANCQLK